MMFWDFVLVVAGVLLTVIAQAVMPPTAVRIVNTEHAIQGDPLPEAAARNRRHLIEIVNGYDVVIVPEGKSYTYKFAMPNVTACQLLSPERSGIDTAVVMTIPPDHPWYPKPGQPVVYRIVCTDGKQNFGDSAIVVLGRTE